MGETLTQRIGELGFTDGRVFHLIGWRHGHGYALLRGMPGPHEYDEDPEAVPRVIDFLFAGARRISCWRDFSYFEIRRPTAEEQAELLRRIGPLQVDDTIYLLQSDTVETHVVADRVYWAEFDIDARAESPLVSEDKDYRAAHPPVGGVVHYAD
ncbi:hypothetical protein J2S43_003228 [Catenuloplanes nepalensis]|uniref:Uncharacterized protein n=1 Tax=Catenuloplanes nepalensis TaxID=587533 RepID=A0ABT9MTX1_9ACTN|nr:hypothetical protein [Catenuloplanes nepalensis]MDP9794716.1 hypothetical protein [Catenuloplanes nepalensis]